MALQPRSEPGPLYRDGEVPSPPKLRFDLSQLGAKALRNGSPLHLKLAHSGLCTDMREAQKVEAFGFTQTALASSLLCEAPELDHAGFLGVQFQAKVPNNPVLAGGELQFQAFSITTVSPPDGRFSNLLKVPIYP